MSETIPPEQLQLCEQAEDTMLSSNVGNTGSHVTGSILKPEAERSPGESRETEQVLFSQMECDTGAEMPAPEEPHSYIFGGQEARIDQRAFKWPLDEFETQKSLHEEEAAWGFGVKEPALTTTLSMLAGGASAGDSAPAAKESQEKAGSMLSDLCPLEKSRLLSHISGGDMPLLSPQCFTFSQSQRFESDPESAPSPPSAQQFRMAPIFSRHSSGDSKEPRTITQLTKYIQSLKRKIQRFEQQFEQEKKYRPSHSDKTANPQVLKWMNDLAKACKRLKELKLKMFEEQGSASKARPRSLYWEPPKGPREKEKLETAGAELGSFREETPEASCLQKKEKPLREAIKVAWQSRMPVASHSPYRMSKPTFPRLSSIATIQEEGDSEDSYPQGSQQYSLPDQISHLTVGDSPVPSKDSEPFRVLPLEENREVKPPTISMSSLHEAPLPVLLEQFREAKADKRRLQRTIREFDDQFYKKTGRNPQKEDRRPIADEYSEYKNLKAKLKLLEALISKQDKDQGF
ncbi:protein FAM13C-like [Sorex fumeus]|uniref:protein FAM13C-like n=1 Tax=Sorex fumeus TaxID=62283 RepID=UPI0024AD1ACE|nr:protein FAM13C-like [Sorex fumeus]